jgi:hypothetical protein
MNDITTFRNMLASSLPLLPTGKNGFHVCLPNNYKVSVQWEVGTYSDNHDLAMRIDFREWGKTFLKSDTAEVAVFNPKGELIETPFSDGDTVVGWQTPADVMKIIEWARNSPHANVCPWCDMPNDPANFECGKCGGPLRKYKG